MLDLAKLTENLVKAHVISNKVNTIIRRRKDRELFYALIRVDSQFFFTGNILGSYDEKQDKTIGRYLVVQSFEYDNDTQSLYLYNLKGNFQEMVTEINENPILHILYLQITEK